jgi:hypothetical protein
MKLKLTVKKKMGKRMISLCLPHPGACCPRTSVCAVDQRNKIMQIVCFFKSDLHGTPRIATHRTTRHTRSDGPCIVLVSYPHTRYIDVRNATYIIVGTIVYAIYRRHTATSKHAWRTSAAHSTRGSSLYSSSPPRRRSLRSPSLSRDIFRRGVTEHREQNEIK